MTTRAEYITKLRRKLDDPDGDNWSDEEISDYLDDAIVEYSQIFPRGRWVEIVPPGDTNRFDVPEDLIDNQIHEVWVVTAQNRLYQIDGGITRQRRPAQRWDVYGEELIFNFNPGADLTIRLRYSALHELPESGDSTVPREDEPLIYTWAGYLAWRKIGAADAALSRWNEDKNRNDSPIKPEYVRWKEDWDAMVERKLARGIFTLRRRGQRYDTYVHYGEMI